VAPPCHHPQVRFSAFGPTDDEVRNVAAHGTNCGSTAPAARPQSLAQRGHYSSGLPPGRFRLAPSPARTRVRTLLEDNRNRRRSLLCLFAREHGRAWRRSPPTCAKPSRGRKRRKTRSFWPSAQRYSIRKTFLPSTTVLARPSRTARRKGRVRVIGRPPRIIPITRGSPTAAGAPRALRGHAPRRPEARWNARRFMQSFYQSLGRKCRRPQWNTSQRYHAGHAGLGLGRLVRVTRKRVVICDSLPTGRGRSPRFSAAAIMASAGTVRGLKT